MARGASPAEGSLFVDSDHQWIDRVLSKSDVLNINVDINVINVR